MKKLLAGALALTLAFSMAACAKSNEGEKPEESAKQKEQSAQSDDGLVTVYQRVRATSYKADGSRGRSQRHYTYDDNGNLLAIETDIGPTEKETIKYEDPFGEMAEIDYLIYHPFDDTIDESTYFVYTDDGYVRDYGRYDGPVIENGKLIDKVVSRSADLYYTYLSDGRINTVELYVTDDDVPMYDEPKVSHKCNYKENNQLISVIGVAPEWNADVRVAEWKYDDQGRMVEERYYSYYEGTTCRRYTYNNQGLLVTVECGLLNVDVYGNCSGTEEVFEGDTYTYTYDDAGRLINSDGDAITYDDQGRVVTYGNATITYFVDGGKKVQDGDQVYEYDQHGNIVRYSDGDGYVEIEYRAIRVTKEQAKRLAYFKLHRQIDSVRLYQRDCKLEYMTTLDYPEIPLNEYKLLLHYDVY